MEKLNPNSRRDRFGTKINRDHFPLFVYGVPWLTILLCSLTPLLPIIAPAPVMPPIAFLALLAWRLLRPGLLPLWAGLPLGLFDDVFSGQPFGSAVVLFSVTLIALDTLELRFPWRGFLQDWLVASVCLLAYLPLAALISGAQISLIQLMLILAQIALSIIVFPLIARTVVLFDRLRLMRVKKVAWPWKK